MYWVFIWSIFFWAGYLATARPASVAVRSLWKKEQTSSARKASYRGTGQFLHYVPREWCSALEDSGVEKGGRISCAERENSCADSLTNLCVFGSIRILVIFRAFCTGTSSIAIVKQYGAGNRGSSSRKRSRKRSVKDFN
jgi:hypothetical protein